MISQLAKAIQPMHPLYGGAIIAHINEQYLDVSSQRPLEDTQEAFVDSITHASLTFDIMVMVQKPIEEAIMTHLKELTTHHAMKFECSNIILQKLEIEFQHQYLKCNHKMIYQNKERQNCFYLVLIRLENVNTDFLCYQLGGSEEIFLQTVKSIKIVDWKLFG